MSNEKICVYTCITGNYDELKEIDENLIEKDVDYYCFTNNKNIKSKTWNVVYIEDFSLTNHMLNRKIKMLGYGKLNNDYDVLVWMDGNVQLRKKITSFIREQCKLDKYSFCAFKHPDRSCIYDESVACVKLKKDNKEIIEKQMKFYRDNGYPRNNGLCEMAVFVRRTKDKKVLETMNLWYKMITEYSKRDQLSFMWCVRKKKLPLQIIPLSISNNKYFMRTEHYKEDARQISKYRLYFGDSRKFEINRVVDGEYVVDNDTYKIENIIVPVDTNVIEFEVCDFPGVILKDIYVNYPTSVELKLLNYYYLHVWNIFFNSNGKVIISGDFKKDEIINITVNLQTLNMEQAIDIANTIKNNLEFKLNESNKNFEHKIKSYQEQINNNERKLSKINQELSVVNEKLSVSKQEIYDLTNQLLIIKNSKAWKFLEKIRKIKRKLDKLFYKN